MKMKFVAVVFISCMLAACGGGGSASAPDIPATLPSSNVSNTAPVANASAAQSVNPGAVVTLDGSASSDLNNDPISYAWTLTSKPINSTASLSAPSSVKPTFTADVAGTYVVTLIVNDGKTSSNPSIVTITAANTNATVTGVGYDGSMRILIPAENRIVSFNSTLVVPSKPPQSNGIVSVWPGLQPFGNFFSSGSVSNGVLQPLLVWGGAPCTSDGNTPAISVTHETWWVEGYYYSSVDGCHGGPVMAVSPGDTLTLTMTLVGTTWTQTIFDANTGQTVTFPMDMLGQNQNIAEFFIEEKLASAGLSAPVTYTNITITLANPQSGSWCTPSSIGATDSMAKPVISADSKTCSIDYVTLMSGKNTFKS
jgi:hypothetical protein